MRTRGDNPMRGRGLWIVAGLIAVGLGVVGCGSDALESDKDKESVPAKVEVIPGKEVKKVTLTEKASSRLGIKTVPVAAAPASPEASPAASPVAASYSAVVPYSAVVYDPKGQAWVYTVPQPLTYIREMVVVATVRGNDGAEAILSQGPPLGTQIVSTGVIELYGAELGVGKRD